MLAILISLLIIDADASTPFDCENIETIGYDKLLGHWYFIGEVSISIPLTRCGYMIVQRASVEGFNARLLTVRHSNHIVKYIIKAQTHDTNRIHISGLQNFVAEVGICISNTLFYIKHVQTDKIFLFSRNMSVASNISDAFEPRNPYLRLFEYTNMNCY